MTSLMKAIENRDWAHTASSPQHTPLRFLCLVLAPHIDCTIVRYRHISLSPRSKLHKPYPLTSYQLRTSLHMGAKKNKLKRMLSPTTPPPVEPSADDDELMDDLFAQLDSRDGAVRHESATVLNEMQIDKVADQLESVPKKDGKARHKARQVRFESTHSGLRAG